MKTLLTVTRTLLTVTEYTAKVEARQNRQYLHGIALVSFIYKEQAAWVVSFAEQQPVS
jgi:hypothetical protein